MVKHEASNAHAAIEVGFHRSIVKFLETQGLWPGFSRSLLKKILSLLMNIAQYSVTADDIRTMFQVFQSDRLKHEAPDEVAVSTYLAAMEMMARSVTGPSTYLELSGSQSGFTIPSLESLPFPSAGYTLSVWIRIESAPGLNSPLFTLCNDAGVGVELSFMETTLVIKNPDWKKENNEVQVPNALVKHQWQWICVVHTHRQIRGSKLDVYINGDARQSYRFSYPNTKEAGTQPKLQCYLARTKNDYSRCLVAHLGPVAFFSQPLQANVLESIKSIDDYDNLVLQYNASVVSSHVSNVTSGLNLTGNTSASAVPTASSSTTSTGTDSIVFAFDARNFDVKRNVLMDASGHDHHGENSSTVSSIRLRTTSNFKESVWQLGGPVVFFPLLLHPSTQNNYLDLTSCQRISRPLGVTNVPKVICLLAETLRHSSINKFICRRSQAIPMLNLLITSLPRSYLTIDLLNSIERLCSAVLSDRFLLDEIHRHLLYNFRLWVPASLDIQNTIFDKLHVAIKKKFISSSVVSVRYMLRLLSTVYRKPIPQHNSEDTAKLRSRILETIRILLYDPESWAKAQSQRKYQLNTIIMGNSGVANSMGVSFDAARTLIFCMLGKATFPQGVPIDYTIKRSTISEAEVDAGALAEHVHKSDIPDLMQILVDFSIMTETQTEFLSIFERLGGLRIWLPLISTAYAPVRRMTLRLLRTYIIIKVNSIANVNPKPSLSAVDVRMIFDSLHVVEYPLHMGSFNELFCLLAGAAYGDPAVDPFTKGTIHDHSDILPDEDLLNFSIRHPSMVIPMLDLIRQSPLHIRWTGLSYFKMLLSSDNVDGQQNRRVFLNCYANQGYPPYPIEVMLGSYLSDAPVDSTNVFSEAFPSVSTTGLHEVPHLRLRDIMNSSDQLDDARLGAALALAKLGDHQSILDHIQQDTLKAEQIRRHKHSKEKLMSERLKTGLVYLLTSYGQSDAHNYMSTSCMDLIATVIVLELKTNDIAYEYVLHPFKITSDPEVVVTWLKIVIDRIISMLDTQLPPKGSLCWRNMESICSIATSVVLHFDPPLSNSPHRNSVESNSGFWRTREEYMKERELSESILSIWQKCASSLNFESDASFGRTTQARPSLTSQVSSSNRSSSVVTKRTSFKDQPTSSTSSGSSLKQFPGGAMRQILGLILRSMHMSIKDQDDFFRGDFDDGNDGDEDDVSPPQRRRSRLNSSVAMDTVFISKLNKLDYFIQVLNINQYSTGKDETSLVLWLVLEMTRLMEDAQRLSQLEPRWNEGTRRCAELITRVIQVPIISMDQLKEMLHREDFQLTESEVMRRDLFYQEYLETSQEVRQKKRENVLAVIDYERDSAKQAVDIVLASGIEVRPENDPVWLQRVNAKDADDWMKLDRLLKWNIQHVWNLHFPSDKPVNWQLDTFTSSKWMRCRLLPDVQSDQTYMKKAKAPISINAIYGEDIIVQESTGVTVTQVEEENEDEVNEGDGDDDERVLGSINEEEDVTELPITVEGAVAPPLDRNRGESILGGESSFVSPSAVEESPSTPTPTSAPAETEPVKRSSMSSRFVSGLRLPMFSTKKVEKPTEKVEAKPADEEPEKGISDATSSGPVSPPLTEEKSEPKKKVVTNGTFRTMAYIILPEGRIVYGMFRLGTTSIVFEGQRIIDEDDITPEKNVVLLKRRMYGIRVIKSIYRRRFRLDMMCGMEIYFVDGTSLLVGFESPDDVDTAFAIFRQRKPPCLTISKRLLTGDRLVLNSNWHATSKWVRREISNFEYLMLLNIAAGRSYNDITQYPIFPWILREYSASTLDLEDPDIFRDFMKPIGAQNSDSARIATNRYQSMNSFPYHFAVPYSNQNTVLSCLIRMAPFGQSSKALGNICEIQPLQSISDHWTNCTTIQDKGWELLPEFFVSPEFLLSQEIGSVDLPPWAMGSVDTFIRLHRQALESDYVSTQLNHWIDLIFGVHQRGPSSVEHLNVFHPICYPDSLNLTLLDVDARQQYAERGTIPLQLFKSAHPRRLTVDEALEARYPASHALASLSSRSQVRRYDVPSRHEMALSSIRFSSATATGMGMGAMTKSVKVKVKTSDNLVNSGPTEIPGSIVYSCDESGLVLAKRYQNSTPDTSKGAPFTLQEVEQWWRLPAMCSIVDGMVYYEHMISCGYFDGSWRIHWSADGELLQRIAFHKQRILCMARSEDEVTGDVALAFGSEDCTISVWAISKFAASRSRRMFLSTAKELPVGNLPWVLLVGHSRPVVSVAINVELDIVASTCRGHTLLLHSLRTSCPLHTMDLSVPSVQNTNIFLTISSQGTILSHAVHKFQENQHENWRASPAQSELSLISINGRVMSRVDLQHDDRPITLLQRGVTFTRCGEYVVTANASRDGGIEVRKIGDLNTCIRRIETNRSSVLTCFGLSQDERCVVAGYEDGSLVMYALHYGISDEGRLLSDKRARAEEAAAFARAANPQAMGGVEVSSLLVPTGVTIDEALFTNLNDAFLKSKKPCVADDPAFEQLLRSFWTIMYPPVDILSDDINYERVGASWSRLGFQRPDPTTDFRAGGFLSLHCLISFASKYPQDVQRMTSAQIPGSHEHTYPWGPVAMNITGIVASLLWKKDGYLIAERENLWPIFAHEDAFYILFSEAFLLFDCAWCSMKAQYSSFSVVRDFTAKELLQVIKDNHGSLNEFQRDIRVRSRALTTSSADDIAANSPQPEPTQTPIAEDAENLITFSPPLAPMPATTTPNDFNLLEFSPPKPHSLERFSAIPGSIPIAMASQDPFFSNGLLGQVPTVSHVPSPFDTPSLDPFSPRNMQQRGPEDSLNDPFAGM
ncbi:hypothetical protein AC1031_001156 [Aphanomyces cochlioides]|nr:hypothetical protein AC1031_001156 [Aphanomyces cochlioides]